ncbi:MULTISPECIES: hypothetical protein [Allokutzneria]|uniref:Type VII secretion system (Wss) protein ESAT-6 n=1 Tax=Allokutzneria multivorans TaxID=1142134 RepID=A0ABP7R5L9_9PSEU|nr:hypothetical protein [Allokutzneria sp. NRRL B-24872]
MASVEQVRAGISLATEKANESIAALQQAASAIEEAQTAFVAASEGSAQDDAEKIQGMFTQMLEDLNNVQNGVTQAISTAEDYANRL